jgi:site-specific DNA-methyltransferase (adenine-specific)
MVETGPGWSLTCADCLGPEGLSTLADKSVDHVITDPPYSDRVHSGMGLERRNDGTGAVALDFSAITGRGRSDLAREWCRLSSRWVLTFCDEESVLLWKVALDRFGATWAVKGTWLKPNPMPRMDGTRPAYATEAVCVAHAPRTKGKTRWNGGGRAALWTFNQQDGARGHPTQKPLPLMLALVSDFTDPGELICDPFAGSCTTGVACIQLGRRFVGWERDPKYFAVAVKRLRAAREQLGLWDRPAVEKFTQTTLTGTDQ